MERKQESRSRAKSPARTASPMSNLLRRRRKNYSHHPEPFFFRSGGLRPAEALSPLKEGPDPDGTDAENSRMEGRWAQWMKGQLARGGPSVSTSTCKRSDLRLLLGVLGAPLAPVHVSALDSFSLLTIKDTPIESSSAQYILQQYTAASGGQKLQNSIHNAYAMGRVRMIASEFQTANKVTKNRNSTKVAESGGFVLWQMNPDMWYVELALGASKVHAGCNGKLVWRHTPWLGAHATRGPVRPLRRALQVNLHLFASLQFVPCKFISGYGTKTGILVQGLDPRTTASMFTNARCSGEKQINGEDCFILKLCADPATLKARSEGPAEIVRHVLFGYFSQKTGLLVHLEDSHLTRIQNNGGDAVYWETTIDSSLEDYRLVEGIMIAHSGRSVVTLFRFGDTAISHTRTRMEEAWAIEEVAFNVPGLSAECFIPPDEIRLASMDEACEFSQGPTLKTSLATAPYRPKVGKLDKSS
ncbi:hypothetical protein GOBAR_AA14913 [Gossypium barbadense]|uniref:Uncharacterized protein n=1 Tax=Gossypium barbadense TaxID=3634 RepID=A0A2P5SRY6_GOSBA|nr:hypothetical protein GOBAR_DD01149 [Gossypium barbadense]PPS05728.1 hypothetical protein GOBAR_AA14913 [Gossypium barbadense]